MLSGKDCQQEFGLIPSLDETRAGFLINPALPESG
jgi:hypothetical protein